MPFDLNGTVLCDLTRTEEMVEAMRAPHKRGVRLVVAREQGFVSLNDSQGLRLAQEHFDLAFCSVPFPHLLLELGIWISTKRVTKMLIGKDFVL